VELGEGKVTVEHGLHPLLAADANPNVGSCNETQKLLSLRAYCWGPTHRSIMNPLFCIWKILPVQNDASLKKKKKEKRKKMTLP
jgi:hypothetical protein